MSTLAHRKETFESNFRYFNGIGISIQNAVRTAEYVTICDEQHPKKNLQTIIVQENDAFSIVYRGTQKVDAVAYINGRCIREQNGVSWLQNIGEENRNDWTRHEVSKYGNEISFENESSRVIQDSFSFRHLPLTFAKHPTQTIEVYLWNATTKKFIGKLTWWYEFGEPIMVTKPQEIPAE